jgi:hypothetical protein
MSRFVSLLLLSSTYLFAAQAGWAFGYLPVNILSLSPAHAKIPAGHFPGAYLSRFGNEERVTLDVRTTETTCKPLFNCTSKDVFLLSEDFIFISSETDDCGVETIIAERRRGQGELVLVDNVEFKESCGLRPRVRLTAEYRSPGAKPGSDDVSRFEAVWSAWE